MDFIFGVTSGDIIYDIETYPNCFTFYGIHADTRQEWCFEISSFKDETETLILFLDTLRKHRCRLVGYNNFNFDYPVIHFIYKHQNWVKVKNIYDKAQSIINSYDDKFTHIIWDNDQIIPQVDLFKIHHFDNMARATSLKVLEFNMKSHTIEDLPFEHQSILNEIQIEILIKYNRYDVLQTLKFYNISAKQIRFREELSQKYDRNFINHNDTKIGKDYFIMELEKSKPGSCYKIIDGKRKMVQTVRKDIQLKDVILPYIKFESQEFNRILRFLSSKIIYETKGVFKDVSCTLNGFKFDFGTGGIHGSVENKIVQSDDDYIIQDWDVASYYPNIAIANRFYPAHLGDNFCKIYNDVYEQRKQYKKKTTENEMLKLALNGVYGDSNNEFSPFYDPQYTMAITINGQLLLCMLVEQLYKIEDLKLLQINTDGFTIRYPHKFKDDVTEITGNWQRLTKLTLEYSEYTRMFIRDVNNYIAEYFPECWSSTEKEVKRKGAYEYELAWHQNHSMLVVPKAAEAYLLHGTDIKEFVTNHDEIHDFMLRAKLPRKHKLEWGGERIQNTTRYYVSTDGDVLEKVMPPAGKPGTYKRKNCVLESDYQRILNEVGDKWDERIHTKNKSRYEIRRTSIHAGWTVQVCNNMADSTFVDINYDFYIQEVEKLVKDLTRGG